MLHKCKTWERRRAIEGSSTRVRCRGWWRGWGFLWSRSQSSPPPSSSVALVLTVLSPFFLFPFFPHLHWNPNHIPVRWFGFSLWLGLVGVLYVHAIISSSSFVYLCSYISYRWFNGWVMDVPAIVDQESLKSSNTNFVLIYYFWMFIWWRYDDIFEWKV